MNFLESPSQGMAVCCVICQYYHSCKFKTFLSVYISFSWNIFKSGNILEEKKIFIYKFPTFIYPNSDIPFRNSSRENSHWAAAWNFQAMSNTSFESGLSCKSSKSRTTPSIEIFSGSCPSEKNMRQNVRSCSKTNELFMSIIREIDIYSSI